MSGIRSRLAEPLVGQLMNRMVRRGIGRATFTYDPLVICIRASRIWGSSMKGAQKRNLPSSLTLLYLSYFLWITSERAKSPGCPLSLSYSENLGAAGRALALSSGPSVLHSDGRGILDLDLGPALDAISLHLSPPIAISYMAN